MSVGYFDCFSGIAGDMILGALFDLGLDEKYFRKELEKIEIYDYEIKIKKVERHHLKATDILIKFEEQPYRSFKDIKKIIQESRLNRKTKNLSLKIFTKLAKAEGNIHNVSFEDVHFHEIGAIDSIIDIVGSAIGLCKLEFKDIYCSKIPLGTGFVNCNHGTIPIPAPATVEILKNIPVYQTNRKQELVTPTGAAIISTISNKFGKMPLMKIDKIGYGSGKTKSKKYPNMLRIFQGEIIKT